MNFEANENCISTLTLHLLETGTNLLNNSGVGLGHITHGFFEAKWGEIDVTRFCFPFSFRKQQGTQIVSLFQANFSNFIHFYRKNE